MISKFVMFYLTIPCFYSMAAAFGSDALFSIVSGMGTPNPVANAITTGVAFAVFQGGFFHGKYLST
jgi:hypothetical protein